MSPHILLIIIDSLRADFISCYRKDSEVITPNIDRLAKDAEVFANMMSCSNHTFPSFASLLTGKYPSKLGIKIISNLSEEENTIPLFLKSRNYKSVSASILRNTSNIAKDFDEHIALPWRKLVGIPEIKIFSKLLRSKFNSLLESINYLMRMYNIFSTTPSGQIPKIFRKLPFKTPLMTMIHFAETHSPYHPPHKYWGKRISLKDYFKARKFNLSHWNNVLNSRLLDESSKETLLKLYKAEVMYVDELIGKLVSYLKNGGNYDDSLIIITADHGESFGDHNLLGHWHVLYEDLLHVPLIIKWPRSERRGIRRCLVQTVDILPTILDYLGICIPNDIDGLSLYSGDIAENRIGIAEQLDSPEEIYGERVRFAEWREKMTEFNHKALAIRQGTYKFITYSNGKRELFNLKEDPKEIANTYKKCDALSAYFNDLLEELYRKKVILKSWELSEKEKISQKVKKLKLFGKI